MIVDLLLDLMRDDEDLRRAYTGHPHLNYAVNRIVEAANNGVDETGQLRILLQAFAEQGATLARSMEAHTELLKRTPAGPWLIRTDGTLTEYHPGSP